MTKAEVAKLVRRQAKKPDKDGNVVTTEVAVKESEVLSFKDYGDRVVVVTIDGRKLTGKK